MKLFLIAVLLVPIFNAQAVDDNSLDEVILHYQKGIAKARQAKAANSNKKFSLMLERFIARQKQELNELEKFEHELFPARQATKAPESLDERLTKEMRMMEKEMQLLFSHFNDRMHLMKTSLNMPKVEVHENPRSYDVLAEIPGMARDDIEVNVVNNDLLIEGSREKEIKHKKNGETFSEFKYGSFKRSLHLEQKVDPTSMIIDYKNGILSVHLDKEKMPKA